MTHRGYDWLSCLTWGGIAVSTAALWLWVFG